MGPERLSPSERFAAWLLTGPVGHAAAAALDIAALAGSMARQRLTRGREGE